MPAGAAHRDAVLALAAEAESAGFDALLLDGRGPDQRDPFVLLGAAAAGTARLALGALCDGASWPPSVLAKAVASLDVCSLGRAIALLAPDAGEDAQVSGEALEVCRLMLRTPAPSFAGVSQVIERAWNEPRARRASPTPVGVVLAVAELEDATLAGLILAAGRAADLVLIELPAHRGGVDHLAGIIAGLGAAASAGDRLPASLRAVALIGEAHEPALPAAAELLAAGCSGLALRWPGRAPLAGELATWRAWLAPT